MKNNIYNISGPAEIEYESEILFKWKGINDIRYKQYIGDLHTKVLKDDNFLHAETFITTGTELLDIKDKEFQLWD